MLGYILAGYMATVFIAYLVIEREWWCDLDKWEMIFFAVVWPAAGLIWLLLRPALRPIWVLAGRGFVFLARGLVFLLAPILRPISKRVSFFWDLWLERWPKQKRGSVSLASFVAVVWTLIGLADWFVGGSGGKVTAIFLWSGAAAGVIAIIIIYFRKVEVKHVNSE